jgi:hypothetical protein
LISNFSKFVKKETGIATTCGIGNLNGARYKNLASQLRQPAPEPHFAGSERAVAAREKLGERAMAENNVRCLYRALTIAVLAVGLPRAAQANLIANGNFSSPVLAYGATYCACSPSEANAIVDWTITVGNVDLVPGGTSADGATWEPPPGGGQSVDLDGTEPGAIAQGFDTTQGRLYTVSFYLSGNPDGPPDIKYLAVSLVIRPKHSHMRPV